MKKSIITSALVFIFLIASSAAYAGERTREFTGSFTPATNGERLLAMLVSLTEPEVIELRMDHEPDDSGTVRNVSIFVQGASMGGFRVEKLAIESSFLELNPPSAWVMGDRDTLQVKNALRSNVEIVALEKDINAALLSLAGGDWSRLSVALKPGVINARGNYRTGGLNILAEVTTGLEIRQGKQIWLRDTSIKINHDDQTDVIRRELQKIQPVVDIGEFPFPVTLAVLDVSRNKIVFSTRTLPKPVEGILYRYVRGS